MAVTERQERSQAKIWGIGVRQIVYMALGAALYGGLSIVTNVIQLPSAGNVSFRPAIVIPLFFGAVFGPWVGLFAGGIGVPGRRLEQGENVVGGGRVGRPRTGGSLDDIH